MELSRNNSVEKEKSDKLERKDSRSNDRYVNKHESKDDRGDARGAQNRWKNKPNNRWDRDNFEIKRERKTPERETGSGRSDFGGHSASNGPPPRNQQDKERMKDSDKFGKYKDNDHEKIDPHSHKGSLKDSDLSEKDSRDKSMKDDQFRMSNREVDRIKDNKEWKKERRDSVDEESDVSSKDGGKSNRGSRREKGGYGVYQAR